MNTVERIKEICKERQIPLYKLEKECGFGNGYIGQLRKGSVPNDRLKKIADYLGVSSEYLSTGESDNGYYINEETAKEAQRIFENKEMKALFDAAKDASPEDLKITTDLLQTLKKKERRED